MLRLASMIALTSIAAVFVRRLAGQQRIANLHQQLNGLAVIFMLLFAIAIMDGVTSLLLEQPAKVLFWVVISYLANPLLQLLGILIFCRFGRRIALTAWLLSGNCNMGLLLAALPSATDFDIFLFFATTQLPMYTLPALLLPLYQRLLR